MNVLLITTDQQRADTLGVAGSPLQATPRLDAFAARGTRYSGARTQNPLCQPARATILTGTYPSTHGVTCNGVDLPPDAQERSIATLLGRAGYRTAIIGKAHFASAFPPGMKPRRTCPVSRGFAPMARLRGRHSIQERSAVGGYPTGTSTARRHAWRRPAR